MYTRCPKKVTDLVNLSDQLIIDNCIMDEVRQHHRNLTVAFDDYKKAYDKVHHDWMLAVYEWIGIPNQVRMIIKELMDKWKTRLEVWYEGKKQVSRWIDISCGFLQGDSFSAGCFCLSEVPVCMLLADSRGYRMGLPGSRNVKRTHSLYVDDLKIYQESHELAVAVNDTIIKASHDTGACYGREKCAEVVFENGIMVKGEGLEILEQRMQSLDPSSNDTYRFLGVEQADGIQRIRFFKGLKSK